MIVSKSIALNLKITFSEDLSNVVNVDKHAHFSYTTKLKAQY